MLGDTQLHLVTADLREKQDLQGMRRKLIFSQVISYVGGLKRTEKLYESGVSMQERCTRTMQQKSKTI